MTLEEAIEYFKKNNERIKSTAIDENRTSKFMKETIDANNIAIRSLEAWKKVKEEIKELANKHDTYDEIGHRNGLWEADDIIDKYLQEVENGS